MRKSLVSFALLCSAAGLWVSGCASGGTGGTLDGGGGGTRDGGATDGDTPPADARPTDSGTRRDGGGPTCGSGQHACGAGCIDDLPNMPENGCRLGCGEACPTPPDGDATCGTDGRCTFDCEPPFRREGDECVCTPRTCEDAMYMCGELDDGCGTPLDCGSCGTGDCIDGTCRCSPDGHEANDSSTTAPNLGSFDDSDDPDDFILSDGTIDDMGDVDWYRFSITDGTDFGNPRLTVTLDQIPMGANYDVAAFYTCGGGTDASTCSMGTVDNTLGHGCAASASGTTAETVEIETECDHLSTDDGGSLYVRVRAASWAGQCAAYRLTLRVR